MKRITKIFIFIFSIFILLGVSNASYNLVIENISLSNGQGNTISKWWKADIDVVIKNEWDVEFSEQSVAEWFVSCNYKWTLIWKSNTISIIVINPWTTVSVPVSLSPLLTATSRTIPESDLVCTVENNSKGFRLSVSEGALYSSSLDESVASIRQHLDAAEPNSPEWGWVTIKNFIFNLISRILVPIMILAWIIIWILWWYEIIVSSNAEKMKKWILKVVFWILWIIIILSAKYIWSVIFDVLWNWNASDIDSVTIAARLYKDIVYPFVKIAIYLVLWILFLILVGKSISIITSGDIKKAWWIVAWAAISILAIIWSKQLVEAVYGKQSEVLNYTATNLWQIWSWILADKNIPLIYDIINWVLGITALVVLWIIIVQAFKILIKPDKADNRKSLWKSLLYIFIWIMIIWAWYLISNLLVIN